jgi:hypothetical protein
VPTAPQNAPKTPEEKKALLDSIFKQGGSQWSQL